MVSNYDRKLNNVCDQIRQGWHGNKDSPDQKEGWIEANFVGFVRHAIEMIAWIERDDV